MRKITEKTEARRAEITKIALDLFFEKGYEATSIRMIQKRTGKEPGLFYYYFSSKDEVFDAAIDLFFEDYEKKMQQIINNSREAPSGTLTRYISFVREATQGFRAIYLKKLHWSILGAIREHTMQLMKKYMVIILEMYIQNGIIRTPEIGIDVTATMLAYGLSGSILYQDGNTYASQEKNIMKVLPMFLGESNAL